WGIGQPLFGAFAEKVGDRVAVVLGIVLYAIGLVLSAYALSPLAHQTINALIGLGIAGSGFGVILAMVGRAASDSNRSMALAIATAAGSGGQLVGPPLTEVFLSAYPWQTVMLIMAEVRFHEFRSLSANAIR
ncbi:MAG: MFS transporter, partial [Planctomycetota bacterium]